MESERIERAKNGVVRAAKAWVKFEDDGKAESAHRQGELTLRLVAAVVRLERRERRAAKRG